MRKWLFTAIVCLWSSGAFAQMPEGEYLEGKDSKAAVILAHGRGVGPDGNVVGPLRRAINKELGFHTLSLRMPEVGPGNVDSPGWAATFPEAYRRIQAAIDFLKNDKGVERLYLMGHSMGGRMATGFLANNPNAGVAGFIGVGLLDGGREPINSNLNLEKIKIPVIDVYGSNPMDAQPAALRKPMVSDRFVQVEIPGAEHNYRGYDKQVADPIIEWLKRVDAK